MVHRLTKNAHNFVLPELQIESLGVSPALAHGVHV